MSRRKNKAPTNSDTQWSDEDDEWIDLKKPRKVAPVSATLKAHQPVGQRRKVFAGRPQRTFGHRDDHQSHEPEGGSGPGNDRELQQWPDYYTFLAIDLARNVISVELDDPSCGQACFCVADFSADDGGTYIGIKLDHFVHVYRCPLTFMVENAEQQQQKQQESCVFVCDCGKHDYFDVLRGMDTSRKTVGQYNNLITPCEHIRAVKWLHDHEHLVYDSTITEEACFYIDSISFKSHVSADLASW